MSADSRTEVPAELEKVAPQGPPQVRPRLWPALVILVLMVVLTFGSGMIAPATMIHFMGMMLGSLGGAVLLVGWWLFFSRIPWRDRFAGLLLFVLTSVLAAFALHESMAWASLFYVLPSAAAGLLIALGATGKWSWTARRVAGALALLAIIGGWATVRIDGLDGNMFPNFAARWSLTREEQFLAELERMQPSATGTRPDAVAMPLEPAAGDWPGFRGGARDGRLLQVELATDWDQRPPQQLWRRRVGPGWSSFCVIGGAVFTQEQRGEKEVVVCYDAATGDQQWVSRTPARFEEVVGGPGPRATPTFHQGVLYTMGATGVLQCLNPATGEQIWQRDVAGESGADTPAWGFSSSPLVVHDHVLVFAGAGDGKGVVAYDRLSGEPAWQGGRGSHSYSSPHLASIGGKDHVLMCSNYGLQALDPETGEVLWEHVWDVEEAARIVQPLLMGEDAVLIGTGYGMGTRRVTLKHAAEQWSTVEDWTSTRLKPYFNDFVLHGGHCYGFDGRILTCLDAQTGERQWKGGRYGHGQLLLVADMSLLLVLSETGDVALVEASPAGYREVTRFKALEGKTWNHPVIAHGKLYVRNGEEAACYELQTL